MDDLNIYGSVLDQILRGIQSETPESVPQCYYVVGRRGYGKTCLLRNLEKTLKKSSGYYPVYVDCLMSPSFSIEETVMENHRSERRMVLLLDDMDMLLDNMERADQFGLRAMLYKGGAPIVVGTGAELSNYFTDYQAPFYDAFILYRLKELSKDVSVDLFQRMRNGGGLCNADVPSKVVSDILDEIGRTPANCRLLSKVISFDGGRERILSEALNPLSAYYRDKIMSLSPSQRKTMLFMLSRNEPVLLKDIREATGQASGDISPQLKALSLKGLVSSTRPDVKKTEYSVADKVMNSWYRNCVANKEPYDING